jgi:hypothetical protein
MSVETVPRYEFGCAGQFMLGTLTGYDDDLDVAICRCLHGPAGCEIRDRQTGRWLGPGGWEDHEDAVSRLERRGHPDAARYRAELTAAQAEAA